MHDLKNCNNCSHRNALTRQQGTWFCMAGPEDQSPLLMDRAYMDELPDDCEDWKDIDEDDEKN